MFKGRNLLIATKHEKEKVIAPILEKELGVKCFVDKILIPINSEPLQAKLKEKMTP